MKDGLTVNDVDYVISLNRFKGVDIQYQYNRLLGIDNQENNNNSNNHINTHNNNLSVLNNKLTLPKKLLDVSYFTRDNIRTLFSIALKLKYITKNNNNKHSLDKMNILKGKCIGLLLENQAVVHTYPFQVLLHVSVEHNSFTIK